MKNFKYAFLMAAAIVLGFSSCSNDEDGGITGDNSKPKSVFLKIEQGPATYSESSVVGDQTEVNFSSGELFFTNGAGEILKHYTISSADTDAGNISMTDVKSGVSLKNLPGAISNVHVVGNVPSGVTLAKTGNISVVKNTVLGVAEQSDINKVNLYGTSALVDKGTTSSEKNNEYTATINLAPTVARIELTEITGGGDIQSFKVAGVFTDNFYKEASMEGKTAAAALIDNGADADIFKIPSTVYDVFANNTIYDWYTTGLLAVNKVAKPGSGVWSYNVFAETTGTAVPRIVIRLENVVTTQGDQGTQFITIKGMKDDSGKLATIEAGKVYSISAGKLLFDETDIAEKPNQNLIDVEVKVTLATWKVVDITPEI